MTQKPNIKTWKDLNIGGIIESGTSEHFHTGDWRSKVPVWNEANCIHCMNCFVYCPDDAIEVTPEGKRGKYKYNFCKGCGVCAEECPVKKKASKAVLEKNPDAKISAWDAAKYPEYVEKAAIIMVSIKDAAEKYGVK